MLMVCALPLLPRTTHPPDDCRIPGSLTAAQAEVNVVKQKWANKMDLPMTEVGVAALFTAEVYAWFCVGEIVGRGGGGASSTL